jgi:hypothetical protein
VLEPTRIEEVKERVREFTRALREAGAEDIAQRIDGYAAGFVDHTQVRRSIDAIKQQLQYFRAFPDELPDMPIVQIAANRLEDVCRDALRAGLIAPARPSLRAVGRRKLSVVSTTLMAAGLALLAPLVLTMFGVDLTDLGSARRLPEVTLTQGEETALSLNALVESADPAATRAVEFYVMDHCRHDLPDGTNCRPSGVRLFGSQKLPTYEVMLEGQVYGLFVAFAETRLIGAVGTGRIFVSTSGETPEGRYHLPLQAAFVGYAPEPCAPWQKLLRRCGAAERGAHLRDEDLPAPTVIVDVVPADPSKPSPSERRRVREELERRERVAERAKLIAGAVREIKAALDDTEKLRRRKQYDTVRQRLDKLALLFAPLDAAITGGDEALPAEVSSLRARFERERVELAAFGDKAFDAAFSALNRRGGSAKPSDDAVLADTAKKLGISRESMDAIYAEHAEQLEARLLEQEKSQKAAERAAAGALTTRCGELPKSAFREVRAYLDAMAQHARVHTRVQECFTPRIHERACWRVVCRFDELVPGPVDDVVKSHTWTFTLQKGRVVEHTERALDSLP